MSYIVTVIFDTDVANLAKAEQEHPEIIGGIMKAAAGRMLGHTRYTREGQTMDVDEYASEEAYRAFFADAGELIRQYGAAAGAAASDTLWKRYEGE